MSPPQPDEYADFFRGYVSIAESTGPVMTTLGAQQATISRCGELSAEQAAQRYAAGKWSVKEIVGHLCDAERVFAYRLLRVARGDQTPLPGFDENAFAAASNADTRRVAELARELSAIRESTLTLIGSLDDTALGHRGMVNGHSISARALVFIIAGHFAHHVHVLRERYGITV